MIGLSLPEAVCYFCTLLVISCIDCKSRRIPNKLLILLLFIRILFLTGRFIAADPNARSCLLSSGSALLLTLVITAIFVPLSQGKTGAGDFKLLLICGFCLGLDLYLQALMAAFILLIITLMIQLLEKQRKNVPFAPFFCAGMLTASIISYM